MKRFALLLGVGLALLGLAFAAGYGLASGPGRQLLRRETEKVLADVLAGEVEIDTVEIVLAQGIGLRGLGVRVYPSAKGPGLQAEQAVIELNEAALLVGDLRLARLAVEGLVLRADVLADGRFTFPPLQSLQNRPPPLEPSPESAPVLEVLAGAEVVGRTLLEKLHIADRIEVHRAEIRFEDHSLAADVRPGTGPQRFRVEGIEAELERPWLSTAGSLSLSGTFSGPAGGRVPVTWRGSARNGAVAQALTVTGLDLAVLDGYVQRLSRSGDIEGTLSGSIQLESAEPGHQRVVVVSTLTRVAPTIVLDDQPVRLDLPAAQLRGRVEIEPGAVRLLDASLEGPTAHLGFEGRFERPVNRQSGAHLVAEIREIGLDDLGPIIDQLPAESLRGLREWFGRLQSGTVERASMRGTTSLATWDALARGELERLPASFLLSLGIVDVTADLGDGDRLVDARFEVDWAGDRLEMRRCQGEWRGEALPEIDISVDGISHFIDMQEAEAAPAASPIPGLPLLLDLLQEQDDEDPARPPDAGTRLQVEVDHLDHPILRWPIRNARVVVEPRPAGVEAHVTSARWGGLPVRAEILYLREPAPHLTVGLEAHSGKRESVSLTGANGTWAQGRFDVEPAQASPSTGISRMSGSFALAGSELRLAPVELAIGATSRAAGEIRIDLAEVDRLDVGLQARIQRANADELGQALGLPAGFITGRATVVADVAGHIDRGAGLFDGLAGSVKIRAKEGEIRRSIPLAVAVATASDGFNPFAKRETLQYESIQSDLRLENGLLSTERLELEGPVRVYASGSLELVRPPHDIDAVVGVFLLQRIRELLGRVPLVNLALPGSNKGFVGAYFRVHGPVEDPEVTTMAAKSLKEGLPELIQLPVDAIEWLWTSESASRDAGEQSGKRAPKRHSGEIGESIVAPANEPARAAAAGAAESGTEPVLETEPLLETEPAPEATGAATP